ncbi:histidine biosynthesis protein [Sinanaerobacter chloroacetimidivorans]|uniref:Histidine biosynthesis protein n=1 Tax=Sinanaerobacter chloroacetimidivorans TaxID=2818044 RepID=A0A8J7W4L7_9FIRM|nr:histidine biosynthesis protein [Sinanaerobacter chloroacetimidivorans]MBR0599100.1 histidine biosynthesis protein [Sinanaerobacter chloroacetimidivorans]
MIKADMKRKMDIARKKVLDAIELHGGTTLLSTGITGDDARMAKAAIDAGAKLLEPNHPAVVLARGYKGVTSMHKAEQIRHEIPISEMAKVTSGVRQIAGPNIYITVGIPGGFTEVMPTILKDEDFLLMSESGADGLHVHKTSMEDLKEVVEKAHYYGLLVDAYIGHPSDLHSFGIPAETPEDVARVAVEMEEIGVDLIGLMTGMSYEGVAAGEIPEIIRERLKALVGSVRVPTLAEGGINVHNQNAFRNTGVNILVVGTAIDDMAGNAVKEAVSSFIKQ